MLSAHPGAEIVVVTPTRERRTGILLVGCALIAAATDMTRNWGGITPSGTDSTIRIEQILEILRSLELSSFFS